MDTFDYQVTMRGPDFDPDKLPRSLASSMSMSSRRGDPTNHGTVFEDGFVVITVGSISEAVSAVRSVRAMQPDKVDDAGCVIGYWFDKQCNLELSADELSALASERVSLSISCYAKPDAC